MLSVDLNMNNFQKRGDICICITESLCCTVEANITLQSSYTPIKVNEKILPTVL